MISGMEPRSDHQPDQSVGLHEGFGVRHGYGVDHPAVNRFPVPSGEQAFFVDDTRYLFRRHAAAGRGEDQDDGFFDLHGVNLQHLRPARDGDATDHVQEGTGLTS